MSVSASQSVLIALLSSMIGKDLDPEKFSLSNPIAINTQYNTRVKLLPTLDTNLYFGSWFNYNRINLSTYTDLVIPINGATRLSQLVTKITEIADFTVIVGQVDKSVETNLSVDDIVDYDLPPLQPNEQRSISLIAVDNSYLFTGNTKIIIHG